VVEMHTIRLVAHNFAKKKRDKKRRNEERERERERERKREREEREKYNMARVAGYSKSDV